MAQPETATLAGGCFWCLEAVFNRLDGVLAVESGYMGGHLQQPTYQDVCSGETGHAEVVRIAFDSVRLSFDELLHVFFAIHDPTTLNRQGNDIGTQYRSAIFYYSEAQRQTALRVIASLASGTEPGAAIVTELVPAGNFYPAEPYHHDYYEKNPNQPYCLMVVGPKVEKFRHRFPGRIKP
ncbi:MAG: peptide-methionine (S)-S-oxide reductase MsrA [Bryobacterales bacterium]|nr:peptide-methionine (S)-S-oxide reductase MsrA [Bryobacterales bacterium]